MSCVTALLPRRLVLTETRRFLHSTPALGVSTLRKPRVTVNIDSHEFHKVIKFVRPDKLKAWDPRVSGDLKPLDPVDKTWIKHELQPFADLINGLPEEQRKLFTVEFGGRRDGTYIILQEMVSQTKRHQYDTTSLDFKITWATWKIRNIQDIFRKNPDHTRSRYFRVTVKELIDKRRKWLNQMRHQDYKRFEWIIEKMSVIYKLKPPHARIERKSALNVLVNLYCNELRDQKMADYKDQLESEKVPFLKEKLAVLMKIREDEESVGLTSSVDEDIISTRKLIQTLEKDHMTIHPTNVANDSQQISAKRS